MNPAWVTAALAFAGALGTAMIWLARWAWKLGTRIMRFFDDYFGTPAHDGVPARPGVMSRLQSMEQNVRVISDETKPNGGTSMRDLVHRTADDMVEVRKCITDVSEKVAHNTDAITHLTSRVEFFEQQREHREGT